MFKLEEDTEYRRKSSVAGSFLHLFEGGTETSPAFLAFLLSVFIMFRTRSISFSVHDFYEIQHKSRVK